MELRITDQAARYLQRTQNLRAGDHLRFTAERTGKGQARINYQVTPFGQPVASVCKVGVTYFVDFADEWLFSGQVFTVDYRGGDDLVYQFAPVDGNKTAKIVDGNHVRPDSTTAVSQSFEDYWE